MALLSQLVGVLAAVTGDPEPGMVVLARSLREAGYITTGGRGRSAAHMTERDAAAMLLAVAAGGDNTRAAHTLSLVGNLRLLSNAAGRTREGVPEEFPIERRQVGIGLQAGTTMLECLTQILAEYANGECSAPAEAIESSDRRPSEVSFIIRHDRFGWSGDINVYLRCGDDVYLRFTQRGVPNPHPVAEELLPTGSFANAAGAKVSSIRLAAIAAHQAMNCVRGTDHPFIRRHDALMATRPQGG
ncbi:hypothetical protein JIX59_03415 [Brevundimonas diminuta]|jgi:hypothetical protein|uniref:hypothetical protein n=1 Tax=Brevundimonas diminuta TaxID=293 RepID=UPI00190658A0|nr:hypothetical protein [Brevundimonas diminuta]MBK1968380.1 hypothetical protein [Brevundimonas diminuta]